MATSVINQIGIHATAETSFPGDPGAGSAVDLSGNGFVVIGSIKRGDDADLADDSVTSPFERTAAATQGPREPAPRASVLLRNGAGEWEFVAFDGAEDLFAIDSSITIASNVAEFNLALAMRTVVLEVTGLWADVFPNCRVVITQTAAGFGDGGQSLSTVKIVPHGTSSVKGGWQRVFYQ